jgi:hypothetical protein
MKIFYFLAFTLIISINANANQDSLVSVASRAIKANNFDKAIEVTATILNEDKEAYWALYLRAVAMQKKANLMHPQFKHQAREKVSLYSDAVTAFEFLLTKVVPCSQELTGPQPFPYCKDDEYEIKNALVGAKGQLKTAEEEEKKLKK